MDTTQTNLILTPRKKRIRPQSEYGRCGDGDVSLRWDENRSAKPICQWIKDASGSVSGISQDRQKAVDRLCHDILDLPPEEHDAVNDYFMCWQKWDWMPINRHPGAISTLRKADKFGEPRFDFCPACYRKIRGLDQTGFRRWIRLVLSAQSKVPKLVELLGFRAKEPRKSVRKKARSIREWNDILRAHEEERNRRMEAILHDTCAN